MNPTSCLSHTNNEELQFELDGKWCHMVSGKWMLFVWYHLNRSGSVNSKCTLQRTFKLELYQMWGSDDVTQSSATTYFLTLAPNPAIYVSVYVGANQKHPTEGFIWTMEGKLRLRYVLGNVTVNGTSEIIPKHAVQHELFCQATFSEPSFLTLHLPLACLQYSVV